MTALRPLGSQWVPLIERATSVLRAEVPGVAPVDDRVDRIVPFLDRVVTWNRKIDLTAARSNDELLDLYLADAMIIASRTGEGRHLDVGSGGGAPGLTLALLRSGLRLTLLEPRAKRVAFLRSSLSELAVDGVDVVRGRSDEIAPRSFAVALSRATLPPAEWLAEGARVATHCVWVLLASGEPPALAGWDSDLDLRYRWPLTRASRRLVRYVPRMDV